MHTETIDIDDAGLSIGGEQFAAFTVSAVCEYLMGEKNIAEFQGVRSLLLDPPKGQRVIISADDLATDVRDSIDEAVRPLFESFMDDAGDVSPPED